MNTHINKGTCSRAINFEVDDNGIITFIEFVGGCMGNTQGVAKLATNRPIDEVIGLVDGIQCGYKGTSCPDQLARALKEYKAAHNL